jgi:hypothetical protein
MNRYSSRQLVLANCAVIALVALVAGPRPARPAADYQRAGRVTTVTAPTGGRLRRGDDAQLAIVRKLILADFYGVSAAFAGGARRPDLCSRAYLLAHAGAG